MGHQRFVEAIDISDDTGTYVRSSSYVNPARDLPTIVEATKTGNSLLGSEMRWEVSANGTDWEVVQVSPSFGGSDADDYSGSRATQVQGITSRRAPYFRLRVKGAAASRGNPAQIARLVATGFSFVVRDEEEEADVTPNYVLRTV